MELFQIPLLESLVALPALAGLTVVLGMDNILAIAIVANRAQHSRREQARRLGLGLALIMRLLLLFTIVYVIDLADRPFTLLDRKFILRDLLLMCGGCFLIGKSTQELLQRVRPGAREESQAATPANFQSVVLQILVIDLTLSLDSVVAVIAMAPSVILMALAIGFEVAVIFFFSNSVARLIHRFPSIETLAICALLLVGLVLISEGIDRPIDKMYVYAMMLFALFVEAVNLRIELAASRERIHQ
jgi:predicted tellurium resistance membrane protein TerC